MLTHQLTFAPHKGPVDFVDYERNTALNTLAALIEAVNKEEGLQILPIKGQIKSPANKPEDVIYETSEVIETMAFKISDENQEILFSFPLKGRKALMSGWFKSPEELESNELGKPTAYLVAFCHLLAEQTEELAFKSEITQENARDLWPEIQATISKLSPEDRPLPPKLDGGRSIRKAIESNNEVHLEIGLV